MNDQNNSRGRLEEELERLRRELAQLRGEEEALKRVERQFNESEARLRQIIDLVPHMIFAKDLQGYFILVNQAVADAYNTTVDKLTGRKQADIHVSEEEIRRFMSDDRHVIETGVSKCISEETFTDALGKTRVLQVTKIPFSTAGSSEPAVLGVAVDITERKRADEALQRSEANYRAIFNAANDAIFVHDIETGRIEDVNLKVSQMYGYDREELLRLRVETLSCGEPPYTQIEAARWIKRAAILGPQLFEWRARHKDGRLFWVEVNLKRAVIRGKDRVLAVVRDITAPKLADDALRRAHDDLELEVEKRTASLLRLTEDLKREIAYRRRMEQWLRDSERRYRTLFDEIPDVIFILDHEGKFTYVNSQVEEFLNCPIGDVLDTSLRDYVLPEDQPSVDSLLTTEMDSIWDQELGLLDSADRKKYSRIRCKALYDDVSASLRYEGVMRDITVRKNLEEELKASRKELLGKIRIIDDLYAHLVESGKSRAIAGHTAEVAHELRQPLAIIGGFARRIAKHFETCLDPRERSGRILPDDCLRNSAPGKNLARIN